MRPATILPKRSVKPIAPPPETPPADASGPRPSAEPSAAAPAPGHGLVALSRLAPRALESRCQTFRKRLKRCRKECSVTAVHQLRVSIRRLLSLLDALEDFLDAKQVAAARVQLKKYLSLLSPLRDAQVQLQCLRELLPDFPALEEVCAGLARQEKKLARRARKKLSKVKGAKLNRSLERQVRRVEKYLQPTTRFPAATRAMRHAIDRSFRDVVTRRNRVKRPDPAVIHRLRVAFKKFRYLIEALLPALPSATQMLRQQMRDCQSVMGHIQDLDVVVQTIERAIRKDRKTALALRPLAEEMQRRQTDAIAAFLASPADLRALWSPDYPLQFAPPHE